MNNLPHCFTGASLALARTSTIRQINLAASALGNDVMKGGLLKGLALFMLVAAFAFGPLANAQTQTTVFLGSAAPFAVLASTTVTNTGLSVINGNVGVSPGTAITGFGPGIINGSKDAGDILAAHAQASLGIAYGDAAGRTATNIHSLAGDLTGLTLTPGLYKSTSTLSLSGTLTLSGKGVYIIQIASGLTVGSAGAKVILAGGATSADIFWQVGSSATIGTYADFKGTIMAFTSVSLATGASLEGRALALHGAVTLDTNAVTVPLGNTILVVLPPQPPARD